MGYIHFGPPPDMQTQWAVYLIRVECAIRRAWHKILG
jgi:hypothetical protein